jgi:glycerol-3-phosphate dehydrogenase (NAD(P)+)
VLGAGSWGTSIAKVIAETHPYIQVRMWAYEKSAAASINDKHENTDFLHGIPLPLTIIATNNIRDALSGASAVLISTPSKVVPDISQKIAPYITSTMHMGFLSKGFCKIHGEVLTISQTIERLIPVARGRSVAISGPSHAEEVSVKFHTCLNIGGLDQQARSVFSALLTCDYVSCRETADIRAVELGGTLKNPAAIAAGMISALPNCGDNLAGALISEAMREMARLGSVFGVKLDAMIDVSGLGDLVATALSSHSRNRRFGSDIARYFNKKRSSWNIFDRIFLKIQPKLYIERMSEKFKYLAEGAYAIEPLIEIAEHEGISIPVYRSLYEVLMNKRDPRLLIETIKDPERFEEHYSRAKIYVTEKKHGLEGARGNIFSDAIISRTLKTFIQTGDEALKNDKLDTIKACNEYAKYRRSSSYSRLKANELSKLHSMNEESYEKTIKDLVPKVISDIIDRYQNVVSRLYVIYLGIIYYMQMMFGYRGRIIIKGAFNSVKKHGKHANIVYYLRGGTHYDFLYYLFAFSKKGMPQPRFLVNSNAVRYFLDSFIIRRAGGFIFDSERMTNPIYRESFYQYISVMIENGVPILISDEPHGEFLNGHNRSLLDMLQEQLVKLAVEIAVVPVRIIHEVKTSPHYTVRISHRTMMKKRVHVNVSEPILLSDLTRQSKGNSLADSIIRSWRKHGVLMPHAIACRVIADNNFRLRIDAVRESITGIYGSIDIKREMDRIVRQGCRFLLANGIVVEQNGELIGQNRTEIEYYASLIDESHILNTPADDKV